MGRFRELDGLRGIAALAVLVYHFTGPYNSHYTTDPRPIFDFPFGAFGVQLFFLISGFVILMSADRAKQPSDFIISRAARIYPAYWASLILALAVGFFFQLKVAELTAWEILINFSMMQRWLLVPNAVDVYWTLAVELQFYVLVFALILVTRSRITDRVVNIVCSVWLCVSLGVAVWASPFSAGIDPQNVVTPVKILLNISIAEFGPLFCTGMLAYLSRKNGNPMLLMPVAGAVSVAVTILLNAWLDGVIIAVICTAFVLIALRPRTLWLNLRVLQWLGKISYSLYIVHSTVGYLIIRSVWPFIGRDWAILVALIGSALTAWVIYEIGERRSSAAMKAFLLSLRRRTRSV